MLSRFRVLIPGVKEHDESFNKMKSLQSALQGEGDLNVSIPYGEGTAVEGLREPLNDDEAAGKLDDAELCCEESVYVSAGLA